MKKVIYIKFYFSGGFQDNYDTSNMRPAVPERERRPNNREKPCRTLFVRNVQVKIFFSSWTTFFYALDTR